MCSTFLGTFISYLILSDQGYKSFVSYCQRAPQLHQDASLSVAQGGNTASYQLNSRLHHLFIFTCTTPSIALSCFSIILTFRTRLILLLNVSTGPQRMWLNVCTANGLLGMQLGTCRYVIFLMWHLSTDFVWSHKSLLVQCFLVLFSCPTRQISHLWQVAVLPILSSSASQISRWRTTTRPPTTLSYSQCSFRLLNSHILNREFTLSLATNFSISAWTLY